MKLFTEIQHDRPSLSPGGRPARHIGAGVCLGHGAGVAGMSGGNDGLWMRFLASNRLTTRAGIAWYTWKSASPEREHLVDVVIFWAVAVAFIVPLLCWVFLEQPQT